MKMIVSSLLVILFSCNSTKKTVAQENFPTGTYEVLELKAEKFKPKITYTINIDAEKQRMSGTFDCNTFSSEYNIDGENIEFGYAMSTKMYCEGNMHNEDAFLGNLNNFNNFKFNGDILEFFNDKNEMILKLKLQRS